MAIALCTRDWKSIPGKLACLGVGMAVGYASDAVVGAAFGKPVHATTGSKLLDGTDDTDFSLPARVPLQWIRRYSSLDRRDGPFGPGWSVPISVQLKVHQAGPHPNIFIDEQGREIAFDAVECGASQWNTAEGYRLARTVGGSFVVESDNGVLCEFGNSSSQDPETLLLQSLEDHNGNALHLNYRRLIREGSSVGGVASELVLHQMSDSAARLYEFEYAEHSAGHHPARPGGRPRRAARPRSSAHPRSLSLRPSGPTRPGDECTRPQRAPLHVA